MMQSEAITVGPASVEDKNMLAVNIDAASSLSQVKGKLSAEDRKLKKVLEMSQKSSKKAKKNLKNMA